VTSGAATGAAASGAVGFSSGNTGGATSGATTVTSGNSSTGGSGSVSVSSGSAGAGGQGGQVLVTTGSGGLGSGNVLVRSGAPAVNVNSGVMQFQSGNVTGTGQSGVVVVGPGEAATAALRGDLILSGKQVIGPSVSADTGYAGLIGTFKFSITGTSTTTVPAGSGGFIKQITYVKSGAPSTGVEVITVTIGGTTYTTLTIGVIAVGVVSLLPLSNLGTPWVAETDDIVVTVNAGAGNAAGTLFIDFTHD